MTVSLYEGRSILPGDSSVSLLIFGAEDSLMMLFIIGSCFGAGDTLVSVVALVRVVVAVSVVIMVILPIQFLDQAYFPAQFNKFISLDKIYTFYVQLKI